MLKIVKWIIDYYQVTLRRLMTLGPLNHEKYDGWGMWHK